MTVLEGVACALITLVILAASAVCRPESAKCPRGTYLHTGIRSSGSFACARSLIGPENDAVQPPGILLGRIYCTGGSRPIVVNERVVGCQRSYL